MRRLAAAVAALVIVAVAAVLVFGGDDPELSPQDQSTPTAIATATATATPTVSSAATISVRIGADGLAVEPLTVTRDGRTVFLDYDNTTDETVEVVFATGNPRSQAAIQKALVTGAVIEAGQKRRDGVQIDPGRYSVLVRAPSEDTDPTDTVSLEVR